jgi:hypothetical protein
MYPISIYEGRLFVCFVCTDEIHGTGMLRILFLLVSLESSGGRGGVHPLGFMVFGTCSAKVLEY